MLTAFVNFLPRRLFVEFFLRAFLFFFEKARFGLFFQFLQDFRFFNCFIQFFALDFCFRFEDIIKFFRFVAAFEKPSTLVLPSAERNRVERGAGSINSRFPPFRFERLFERFERRERLLRATLSGKKSVFFSVLFAFSDF